MLNMGKDQQMLHSETSYDIKFIGITKSGVVIQSARIPQEYHIVSSYH